MHWLLSSGLARSFAMSGFHFWVFRQLKWCSSDLENSAGSLDVCCPTSQDHIMAWTSGVRWPVKEKSFLIIHWACWSWDHCTVTKCWAANTQWCIAVSCMHNNCVGTGWLVIAMGRGHNNEGSMTVLSEPTTTWNTSCCYQCLVQP